jgi:radical SAM protein with 4Fe4S-binding SPASM domain
VLETAFLHVTKNCNLRCTYCYFQAGEPEKKELTTEEMLQVINDLAALSPARIVFTGGEPLTRKDIFKLAQASKNAQVQKVSLTTNGTLINNENAPVIVDLFDEVRISIDGPPEINDSMRGEGTYWKAMSGLHRIIDAGGNPSAFITVTSVNLPFIKNFAKFLMADGIHQVHFSPLKLLGRVNDRKFLCDPQEMEKVVEEFWFETFGLRMERKQIAGFNCGAGKFLSIHPDGSVFPCHVLVYPEFCLGNLRTSNLSSIYSDSPLMIKLRNVDFRKLEPCRKCMNWLLTNGACLGTFLPEDVSLRKKLISKLFGYRS